MRRSFKSLIVDFGGRQDVFHSLTTDLEKVSSRLEGHSTHIDAKTLRKLWADVVRRERPSRRTLDRLALFAGFQTWEDLRATFHGDTDAQINYEDNPTNAK